VTERRPTGRPSGLWADHDVGQVPDAAWVDVEPDASSRASG